MKKKETVELEINVDGTPEFADIPKDVATAFLKALEQSIVDFYDVGDLE